MSNIRYLGGALLATTVLACGGDRSVTLESDDQKASYAIGLDMGGQLEPAADHVDVSALLKGVEDALAGREPAVAEEELREIMTRFNQTIREEQEQERAAMASQNETEGAAFLADNGNKEGVTTTESGLQYEVIAEGDGPRPESGQRAILHYRGTLLDGTEFDSSYGGDPANFAVDGLIPGFTEALRLMSVGSHYRIWIPSNLAYGPNGAGGDIGPNATLIFEIELIGVE